MDTPLFAYYTPTTEHTTESIQETLLRTQLDECWMRIRPTEHASRNGDPLLMLQMYDLRTGAPANVPDVGEMLSAEGRTAFLVGAADPEAESAAFEIYRDGETAFSWAGELEGFDAQLPNGQRYSGRDDFFRAFAELAGVGWQQLLDDAGQAGAVEEEADINTDLLLRGRVVGLPAGIPRRPEVFFFHYAEQVEEGAEAEAEAEEDEPGDRMALALLDLRLVEHLWNEAPAEAVLSFLKALESVQGAVLGPLAHALPRAIAYVEEQDLTQPMAAVAQRELIVYELLAMASSAAFQTGDTVDYFDQCFLPLLSLTDDPVNEAAVRASLDEIQGLDVLHAMAEVLPYHVPEGELLESLDDSELAPLVDWALGDDGEYEGSLFLLDLKRLSGLVQRFDSDAFSERIEAFLSAWTATRAQSEEPEEHRAQDEMELARFSHHFEELQILLALCEANQLQPALFFYGR
jgi:hypothetical protein